LLREYPVSRVAPLSLLIPVFGVAGSVLMLGHRVDINEGLSILLILAALVAGLIQGRRPQPRTAATVEHK
jgi:O-acetylserine/cysteine efflux transporter